LNTFKYLTESYIKGRKGYIIITLYSFYFLSYKSFKLPELRSCVFHSPRTCENENPPSTKICPGQLRN
jgi:hypothetical protein